MRFYDGGVAFLACAFGDLNAAEASQMELGLLPMPKADADGSHRTPADVHGFTMLALPLGNAPWDLSDLTVVLEAAALYNSEYVTPVYRDETLRRYGLTDEADRELFDLIQSTRAADLGVVYRYDFPLSFRYAYIAAEDGKNGPIGAWATWSRNPPDPIATGVENMAAFAEMIANDLNYYIDRYDIPTTRRAAKGSLPAGKQMLSGSHCFAEHLTAADKRHCRSKKARSCGGPAHGQKPVRRPATGAGRPPPFSAGKPAENSSGREDGERTETGRAIAPHARHGKCVLHTPLKKATMKSGPAARPSSRSGRRRSSGRGSPSCQSRRA